MTGPWHWGEAVAAACNLAAGLAEAHRFGLVHGCLDPGMITGQVSSQLKIEWSGLDTDVAARPGPDPSFQPPEARHSGRLSPSADVFALGMLLAWWISGRNPGLAGEARLAADPATQFPPPVDDRPRSV